MGNKITTLVLNCLTAFFSMFAIVETYLFCQYGRTVFFFTQSKDPIYRTGELVSEVEFLLALVSMGLGVISFFVLRKNKRKKYLLIQLLLFPYNMALLFGSVAANNYITVRQVFYTGSFSSVPALMGVGTCIAGLILAIICYRAVKGAAK